jgi:CheY-like chemotaxis protein
MLNQLLQGFQVLIVSDHAELAALFAAILGACGAIATKVSSVSEALGALRTRPTAVLLDLEIAGNALTVPVEASNLRVPVVVLTHRCPDPHQVPSHVKALAARLLHSTELEEVCETLLAVTSEGP